VCNSSCQGDACLSCPHRNLLFAEAVTPKIQQTWLYHAQGKRRKAASDEDGGDIDRRCFNEATGQWDSYELPSSTGGAAAQPENPEGGVTAAAVQLQPQPAAAAHAAPAPDAGGSGGSDSDSDRDGFYSDSSSDAEYHASAADSVLAGELAALRGVSTPLLAVDALMRQGVFLVRHRPCGKRKWRFAFLGFRIVRFSDGERLVGYGKACICGADTTANAMLEGQDRPGQPQAWLRAPALCDCGRWLVQQLGGDAAVRRLFALAPAGNDYNIVQQLSFGGMTYFAIRAGASFWDWGIVDSKGRCCSCTSRQWSCDHVNAMPASAQLDSLRR